MHRAEHCFLVLTFFLVQCQQEYFNLFSDESTEKQFRAFFLPFMDCCPLHCTALHALSLSVSFTLSLWPALVNIFRVHPQLLQITDFSITIYFDVYFYAISRQFVVAAPKNSARILQLSFSLSLYTSSHPQFCIINCQQCHKIFSFLFAFLFILHFIWILLYYFFFFYHIIIIILIIIIDAAAVCHHFIKIKTKAQPERISNDIRSASKLSA